MSDGTRARLRFQLAAFPQLYSLPSRPSGVSPAVQDAHRQTTFLLGEDLAAFEGAMSLQLAIVAANAKSRQLQAAALLTFWSRTFSHLSDTCALMCSGSYASCAPLLRAVLDCIAVQQGLIAEGFVEYEEWWGRAISQDRDHGAMALDLGRYRAASRLAEDERLGTLYRLLSDLSMPHFGSSALFAAPDSSLNKLLAAFADSTFHLGWAQLISGWLLMLARAQIETVAGTEAIAAIDEQRAAVGAVGRTIAARLDNTRRCYVEPVGDRFLFHNFRRTASGQPKRILL